MSYLNAVRLRAAHRIYAYLKVASRGKIQVLVVHTRLTAKLAFYRFYRTFI